MRSLLAKRCGPMLHVRARTEKFLSSISDVGGWCFCVARYQRGSIKHGETHRCPVALVRERSNSVWRLNSLGRPRSKMGKLHATSSSWHLKCVTNAM